MRKILILMLFALVKMTNAQENLYFVSGNTGNYINFYTKTKPMIFSFNESNNSIDTLISVYKSDTSFFSSLKVYDEFGLIAVHEVVETKERRNYLHIVDVSNNFQKNMREINIRGDFTYLIKDKDDVYYCINDPKKDYLGYNKNMKEKVFSSESLSNGYYIGERDGILFDVDDGLRITRKEKDYYINKTRNKLQIEVPKFERGQNTLYRSFDYLAINNDFILCILISNSIPQKDILGTAGYYIYNKKDSIWYYQEFKGNRTMFTAYGWWIAGYMEDANKGKSYLAKDKTIEYDFKRIIPGKYERKSAFNSSEEYNEFHGESDTFEGRLLKNPKTYFPGILFVFNAKTKQYFEWDTGQGDSEILLIKDNIIYYRVNDEIYQREILQDNLGESLLMVKDDRVPDIHWAITR